MKTGLTIPTLTPLKEMPAAADELPTCDAGSLDRLIAARMLGDPSRHPMG